MFLFFAFARFVDSSPVRKRRGHCLKGFCGIAARAAADAGRRAPGKPAAEDPDDGHTTQATSTPSTHSSARYRPGAAIRATILRVALSIF